MVITNELLADAAAEVGAPEGRDQHDAGHSCTGQVSMAGQPRRVRPGPAGWPIMSTT